LLTALAFDTGPQFVFNFGGGPGIRVHQFGGARPRRRPRDDEEGGQGGSTLQTLLGLLPIIFFFLIPLLTSLFSGGDSTPAGPRMVYDQPIPPYTAKRATPNFKVNYFVNPNDILGYSSSKLSQLDKSAEANLVRVLRQDCDLEERQKQRLLDDAYGWLFADEKKLERANQFELKSCNRLKKLGVGR
jgi:DnaJ homolog subfamily B member 12